MKCTYCDNKAELVPKEAGPVCMDCFQLLMLQKAAQIKEERRGEDIG